MIKQVSEEEFRANYPALSEVYLRVFGKPCDYRQPTEKTESREIYSESKKAD